MVYFKLWKYHNYVTTHVDHILMFPKHKLYDAQWWIVHFCFFAYTLWLLVFNVFMFCYCRLPLHPVLFACIVRLHNLHKNKAVLPYFTCGRVRGAVGSRCQQIMERCTLFELETLLLLHGGHRAISQPVIYVWFHCMFYGVTKIWIRRTNDVCFKMNLFEYVLRYFYVNFTNKSVMTAHYNSVHVCVINKVFWLVNKWSFNLFTPSSGYLRHPPAFAVQTIWRVSQKSTYGSITKN